MRSYIGTLPRKGAWPRRRRVVKIADAGRVLRASWRDQEKRARVARIAGVNIPTNKRVVIALQYIHGIGPTKAKEITGKVGIADARRVSELTDAEVLQIREA